jgi:hypothetical protein
MTKWVVQEWDYRDDEDEPCYELSVVVEDSHGTRSWGWPGRDKVILVEDEETYPDEMLSKIKKAAEFLCELLNNKEK